MKLTLIDLTPRPTFFTALLLSYLYDLSRKASSYTCEVFWLDRPVFRAVPKTFHLISQILSKKSQDKMNFTAPRFLLKLQSDIERSCQSLILVYKIKETQHIASS